MSNKSVFSEEDGTIKKKVWIIIAVIIVTLTISYCIIGNPFILYNNYRLKQSIHTISKAEVTLNEIVPFEWDTVYTFSPYTARSEIEEIIGFKSNAIKETVNEGMVQLLFVNGKTVSGSVCGYAQNLGYSIDFTDKVEFEKNSVFEVYIQDNIIYLSKR